MSPAAIFARIKFGERNCILYTTRDRTDARRASYTMKRLTRQIYNKAKKQIFRYCWTPINKTKRFVQVGRTFYFTERNVPVG